MNDAGNIAAGVEVGPVSAPGPDAAVPRSKSVLAALQSIFVRTCDPEWLLFTGVLLSPALLLSFWRQAQPASFFAGLALYVAVLKWLGWLVLPRAQSTRLAWLR